jgi:ubiquinone/menaquinone biosynthesis C-methylase UbiE
MATNKREIKESYDNLGGRVYDLRYEDNGCGTGLLFEYLSTTAVGLDISSGLLSKALSRTQDVYDKHLIQGDSENLPLRGLVFSRVFAITLIQNTPNPAKALNEMSRVGNKGTLVVVTSLKKAFSEEAFRHIIDSAGFVIMKIINDEKLSDIIAILSLKIF